MVYEHLNRLIICGYASGSNYTQSIPYVLDEVENVFVPVNPAFPPGLIRYCINHGDRICVGRYSSLNGSRVLIDENFSLHEITGNISITQSPILSIGGELLQTADGGKVFRYDESLDEMVEAFTLPVPGDVTYPRFVYVNGKPFYDKNGNACMTIYGPAVNNIINHWLFQISQDNPLSPKELISNLSQPFSGGGIAYDSINNIIYTGGRSDSGGGSVRIDLNTLDVKHYVRGKGAWVPLTKELINSL